MKFSLSWLSDYVSIATDVDALAEALTMRGLEVESVINRYAYLDNIHVARIADIHSHPNSDRLNICRVETGTDVLSVICGAPNVRKDMLAPLALPGATLPGGIVVEKSAIRGQTSEGMLCSAAELALGADQSGILALDARLTVGDRLTDALNLADFIIELDLTPNRPDCLSIIGIAREIAAIQRTSLHYPDCRIDDRTNAIAGLTSVRIEAPNHCPRYVARVAEHITIAPSPFWLQDRLLSVGLRPINNIVDITNFVLMETGQPLHAFDFDRLAENRIVVRTATAGETFVTLDQKERMLGPEMLLICDGQKPVAIGGVMGGLNSEINPGTTRILFESAYFTPSSIRRTSKRLGLATEASHRFERGVDPLGTIGAVNRAARLTVEIGAGTLIDGLIDEHPIPHRSKRLLLSTKRTNRLLGTRFNRRKMGDLLESIGFSVASPPDRAAKDQLVVNAPSFRVDIARPEDLMEEVARLSGYHNIPTTYPLIPAETRPPAVHINLRNRIRNVLVGFGFAEAITYSFMDQSFCDRLRLASGDERRLLVNIVNPLTEDQAVLRTSILPGLLGAVHHNSAHQMHSLKLFEIGKIFINENPDNLPRESEMLVGLWTGARCALSWHTREILCDFYDIKGVVEGLLQALKVDKISFTRLAEMACAYTRPGYSAQILADNQVLGLVGEIDPQVLKNFDMKQAVYIFEIDFGRLVPLVSPRLLAKPTPRFPAVFRDITIHVPQDVAAQDIVAKIHGFDEKLIESVHLFDVFEGDPIPADKKSISIRITYRSSRNTLEDEDVRDLHKSITDQLVTVFNASLPA